MIFKIFLLVCFLHCIWALQHYQFHIPNGQHVPFPCKTNTTWGGVGHLNSAGGGTINEFGKDFAANNHIWTKALCQKDSDGDGRTNGEELGDPNCTWTEGGTAQYSENITHPGICDPWDSGVCKMKPFGDPRYETQGEWLAAECPKDGLHCEGINDTDVKTLAVRLDETNIPAEVTRYECQIFNLTALGIPGNQSQHIIAVTPLIDNVDIVHHMILSGCENDTKLSGPYNCGAEASSKCRQFLHVWAVGLDGECYHPLSGIRIGTHGFTIVALQLHWNNPALRTNLNDSSGVLLHYTPKLRQFDAGVLMTGSIDFALPPKQPELNVHSTCPKGCTQRGIKGPISVTSAWNHMHYAGRNMSIEVERKGKEVIYLTKEKRYSYESPTVYKYLQPIEVYPGDEIKTTCGYQTVNRTRSTLYGLGTQDEMCFGFITYYPAQNMTMPDCLDSFELSRCDGVSWGNCSFTEFLNNLTNQASYKDITENCQIMSPCLEECVDTIVEHMKTDPCMTGNKWQFIQSRLLRSKEGQSFLARVSSCKEEVYARLNPSLTKYIQVTETPQRCGTDTLKAATVLVAVMMVVKHMFI